MKLKLSKKDIKANRGITLIALVITIIVLLILAGVTIATLTGDNGLLTKAGEARNTNINAENIEKIKLAYQDYYLGKHTQSEYTLQKALDKTFGEDVAQVTGEGPWTITTGDRTYSLDSNGTVTPNSSGGSSTSVAYEVGDVVRLGGEDFYVIERSDAKKTTVKLLAKYNVKTTSGEGQYTQRSDANPLRFDDDYSNVYYDDTTNPVTEAEIKTHVDAYKTALEGRMGSGKTIQEARLMLKEEVEALGGDAYNCTTEGCPKFINEQAYWLGSPYESTVFTIYEWFVLGSSSLFNIDNVCADYGYGLRPVVIVLKSNI